MDQSDARWFLTTARTCGQYLELGIEGGHEADSNQSKIFIGKATHGGEEIPCKIVPHREQAYIPYGGEEIEVTEFQIYCPNQTSRIRWVHYKGGAIPNGAVVAGHTESKEKLYFGRIKYRGSLTPGKFHPSHKRLYISYGGEEIYFEEFDVMVEISLAKAVMSLVVNTLRKWVFRLPFRN